MPTSTNLISPYNGKLVDLIITGDQRAELLQKASTLRTIQITRRQMFDLEMLATGGFSPIDRFMGEADYRSVLSSMALADGTLFPIPITLSVHDIDGLDVGSEITLLDDHNNVLAIMSLDELYPWDPDEEAKSVLGTDDRKHPFWQELSAMGRHNLSGRLSILSLPGHVDNVDLRLTPAKTRSRLEQIGLADVVAFQTRNPIHGAHEALMRAAMSETGGTLLLHPVVGMTKEGDIDHYTRVRVYRTIINKGFAGENAMLALLPLAMRMAGPREAVLHAIIRRNYGANHFIVGRDHASPGIGTNGKPYYEPSAARELAISLADKIGVSIMPFDEFVYAPERNEYVEVSKLDSASPRLSLSGTEIREGYVDKGIALPEWFTRPEVASIIAESYPPKRRQGFCVWFTGLSGSGKSTTADILSELLLERGRQSTMLDGDVVRTHLSKGLGFSKEDRDANVTRIGFVASEVARHGGASICAAVSPYRGVRDQVRRMFEDGHFIEIFVDTPLQVCEDRDTKGMYAKARRGEISNFTGIDDEYEPPLVAELRIETETVTAAQNAAFIVQYLEERGFLELIGV